MMLLVVLSILVSMCAVHGDGVYGNVEAVQPRELRYVQDLIDLPKPLGLDLKIQRCGRYIDVALVYLCAEPTTPHSRQTSSSIRRKRQIADECCLQQCTLENFLLYCPQ